MKWILVLISLMILSCSPPPKTTAKVTWPIMTTHGHRIEYQEVNLPKGVTAQAGWIDGVPTIQVDIHRVQYLDKEVVMFVAFHELAHLEGFDKEADADCWAIKTIPGWWLPESAIPKIVDHVVGYDRKVTILECVEQR